MKTWKPRTASVYASHGYYYFKVTMPDGSRKTIPTGESSKALAEEYMHTWLKANEDDYNPHPELRAKKGVPRYVGELFNMFVKPEVNPKYLEAQSVKGLHYSDRRATAVARHARQALEAMGPYYRGISLAKVTRQDMAKIREAIRANYGARTRSDDIWSSVKSIMSYAADQGWVKTNPSVGMSGIKYIKGKGKIVLPYMDVRRIYARPELFDSEEQRDIFYLLATTGLRRAEFAALQGKQFKEARIDGKNVLCMNVCQAYKNDSFTKLGLPKWDIVRVIPLAETTANIMRKYIKGKEDFLFRLKADSVSEAFANMVSRIDPKMMDRPEALETLTPHVMRHSLNTVLREEDAPDVLIQEYLSWKHQDENRVQSGYTHIYIKGLMKVSEKIEALYAGEAESVEPSDDDVIIFD